MGSKWSGIVYTIAVIIACTILLSAMSGCSKNEQSLERIAIRYNNPENLPELVRLTEDIIRDFEKENPDIKIKLESGAGSPDKIIVQMAGGVAPDVFFWWLNPDVLIDKGQLLAIDKYIKKYNLSLSDYYSQAVEAMSKNGKVYGLPLQFKDVALVYNKDMFDKTGLGYPDETWMWEDYYNAAKKLTRDSNGDGRRDQFGSQNPDGGILVFVKMNNGQLFDFTSGLSLLQENKRTQEAIKFYKKLYDDTCPTASETESIGQRGGGGVNAFISGRIGMFICWNYLIRTISLSKNINWDVAPVPKSPDGVRRQVYAVGGICISSQTKHPDVAFRFISFYCGEKGMKIFGKAKNGIAAYKEVGKTFFEGHPSGMKYYGWGLQDAVPLGYRSDAKVISEVKDQVIGVFTQEYDLYQMGEISFEQLLTRASKNMEYKFKNLVE